MRERHGKYPRCHRASHRPVDTMTCPRMRLYNSASLPRITRISRIGASLSVFIRTTIGKNPSLSRRSSGSDFGEFVDSCLSGSE